MVALLRKKTSAENIRELGPALAILLATLIISTFITEFAFTFGLNAAWKTLFRFLRLSFFLTAPLFLLPGICAKIQGFLNRGNRQLVRIGEDRDTAIFIPSRTGSSGRSRASAWACCWPPSF
jgi:hypothetical protein